MVRALDLSVSKSTFQSPESSVMLFVLCGAHVWGSAPPSEYFLGHVEDGSADQYGRVNIRCRDILCILTWLMGGLIRDESAI